MRVVVWRATALILAAWITVHFTLVLLSVLPLSPLSLALSDLTNAYVIPVFAQNWNLFSPNPVATDLTAYARGIYREGEPNRSTPWIDCTNPLVAAVQHNRLTALNLPLTAFSKAAASVAAIPALVDADAAARERLLDEWTDDAKRPRGLVVLESGGAAAVTAAYPAEDFAQVQVMLSIRPVPRFSERDATTAPAVANYFVFRPVPFPRVASWPPMS